MNTTYQHILCDCQQEGILICAFNDEYENEVHLSIYKVGQFNPKPSILNRLKYCWYHLKTGKKYEDQIIITPENGVNFAKTLLKHLTQ